jgi:squalene cyclase
MLNQMKEKETALEAELRKREEYMRIENKFQFQDGGWRGKTLNAGGRQV